MPIIGKMRSSVVSKALLLAGSLALLLALGGEIRNRVRRFAGESCVSLGGSERMVVRRATHGRLPLDLGPASLTLQRDTAVAAIDFDDPLSARGLLDVSATYDAARMPFALQLEHIEIIEEHPALNLLKVTSPEGERTIALVVGEDATIEGESFRIAAIREWSGLLRDANGTPMAAVSLRHPSESWTTGVFLHAGRWTRVEPGVGLRLSWFESDDAARESLALGLSDTRSARWGVVDGPAVNWFEVFVPGTGAQLRDGTVVTLDRYDEGGSRIVVRVEKGGETRLVEASANARDPNALVRLESPSQLDSVIVFNAVGEGRALAAAYEDQRECGRTEMAAGETWAPEEFPYEVRLDQVLAKAVIVQPDASPLYEAVLQGSARELRFRQGEAVRSDDNLLQFVRVAVPPDVRYTFVVAEPGTEKARTFTLAPKESVRHGDWVFTQGAAKPGEDHLAVLHAHRKPAAAWTRIMFAVAFAAFIGVMANPRTPTAQGED